MIDHSGKKTVAGKYVVYQSEILGKGTFATTYLAKLKSDPSQLLACKLMNKNQIQSIVQNIDYLMKRVKDEVKAWKEILHPNIVKFQGCEETKNNIYFFLEYCSQGSLETYISKNQFQIKIQEVVGFAKQLVSACAYIQSKNILHRDIKPANIMLKDSQVKLGDFGMARVINLEEEDSLVSFFTFAGTLQYMAPEILNYEKYPYKCDVWSVGVTIFEMCTNDLPFGLKKKDHSENLILQKITKNKEEFNYEIFKQKPSIAALLKKMLDPNPHTRPKMSEIQILFQTVD